YMFHSLFCSSLRPFSSLFPYTSLFRSTDFAKDIGGSVRRAAEGTRDTEAFSEAKEKAGSAFGVVREEASDAVNNVKSRINERRDEKSVDDAQDTKPQKGDDVADPTAEVVEGE